MRRTVLSLTRFLHLGSMRPARRPGTSPRRLLVLGGLLAAFAGSAQSASGAASAGASGQPGGASAPAARSAGPQLDNSGDYRQELRACREGRTAENLSTCLREAHAAEADRKRGRLTNTGDFEQNALARCQAFKQPDDKAACRARIVGQVEIEGSVAGGGILRQVAMTSPSPETAETAQQPGSGAMGASTPPATLPPSDDIGNDEEDLLPEAHDLGPGPQEGERLEEQTPMTEPSR